VAILGLASLAWASQAADVSLQTWLKR